MITTLLMTSGAGEQAQNPEVIMTLLKAGAGCEGERQ